MAADALSSRQQLAATLIHPELSDSMQAAWQQQLLLPPEDTWQRLQMPTQRRPRFHTQMSSASASSASASAVAVAARRAASDWNAIVTQLSVTSVSSEALPPPPPYDGDSPSCSSPSSSSPSPTLDAHHVVVQAEVLAQQDEDADDEQLEQPEPQQALVKVVAQKNHWVRNVKGNTVEMRREPKPNS